MSKKFLIVLLLLICGIMPAQKKKTIVDSSFQENPPVEILTKIKLDSALAVPPLYFEKKIFAIDRTGMISCFDSTGKILWNHNGNIEAVTKPSIADGELAYGTANGEIITIDVQSGNQIQSIGIDDSLTTDLVLITYKGNNELMMPKQSESKSSLIFGTVSGKIFCLDLETLQEYWRNNDVKSKISSQPLIIENRILFTRSDGFIYCIDSRTGLLTWRWKETAETDFSDAQIICDGKKLYAISKENALYCIDILLGKFEWKFDKIKIQTGIGLSGSMKNLLAKSIDKKFLILSAESGKIIKEIKHEEPLDNISISPIEYKGEIFFTNRSNLYLLDKKYKEQLCINLHEETFNSFSQIDENKFLISSAQGTIIIFKLR
jgi:hypothetical protein